GEGPWLTRIGSVANLGAIIAGFSATGLKNDRWRRPVFITLGLVGLVMIGAFEPTTVGAGIGALLQAVVLGAILGALSRRILQHEQVTLSTILGVISAYVLIGLIFAWIYLSLVGFRPDPVLDPPTSDVPVYYSFVVLTTLGFGDITPVDELAERITAFEAIVGQVFLATVVARFVAMYGQRRPSRPSG
uniref:ion channel n=1 Tax=Ilumatobacter nonamiensis TaxID=467093 RepID=UPI00058B8250